MFANTLPPERVGEISTDYTAVKSKLKEQATVIRDTVPGDDDTIELALKRVTMYMQRALDSGSVNDKAQELSAVSFYPSVIREADAQLDEKTWIRGRTKVANLVDLIIEEIEHRSV